MGKLSIRVITCMMIAFSGPALSDGPVYYCLDRPGKELDRSVIQTRFEDFASKGSFQIRTTHEAANPDSPIRFIGNKFEENIPGDRITTVPVLYDGSNNRRVLLEHTRVVDGKVQVIARAELQVKRRGKWAKGAAMLRTKNGWEEVGVYYMYRLDDAVAPHCRRNGGKEDCRFFHFDFFWKDDKTVDAHRPERAMRRGACEFHERETDEGDGEEGNP